MTKSMFQDNSIPWDTSRFRSSFMLPVSWTTSTSPKLSLTARRTVSFSHAVTIVYVHKGVARNRVRARGNRGGGCNRTWEFKHATKKMVPLLKIRFIGTRKRFFAAVPDIARDGRKMEGIDFEQFLPVTRGFGRIAPGHSAEELLEELHIRFFHRYTFRFKYHPVHVFPSYFPTAKYTKPLASTSSRL